MICLRSMLRDNKRLFKVNHEEPRDLKMDYILLPYGAYYKKTAALLEARDGDMLRFYNGRDVTIRSVTVIEDRNLCNVLCRMRYGVPWGMALSVWRRYAVMEGNGKDILVDGKCIMVAFEWPKEEK